MCAIRTPPPVKLITAMLSTSAEALLAAAERLAREYGPIDLRSETMAFDFTHYYDGEMGSPLLRQFLAFERLIDPGLLAAVKLRTNALEDGFARGTTGGAPDLPAARPVNLDPGYVSESKLVLASTKDFAHRLYLGEGIFAEITLTYAHGRWTSHSCTFPDYASGKYDAFLTSVRHRLREQLGRKESKA